MDEEEDQEEWSLIDIAVQSIIDGDLKKLKDIAGSIPAENVSKILSGSDENGNVPLIQAIDSENVLMVKFLLENCHVDPLIGEGRFRYPGYFGKTPIHACCQRGNLEILRMLNQSGAVHREIYEGFTPLQQAAIYSNETVLSYYLDKNYYTREEICDCFELLGVASLKRRDLPTAIRVWNRALTNRSHNNVCESFYFGCLEINMKPIENYNHLSGDLEHAAIHSFVILERVLGIDHIKFCTYFRSLLKLIPIKNIEFWEAIQKLALQRSNYGIFQESNIHYTIQFQKYISKNNFRNINSSVLNIFYKFLINSLKMEFLHATRNVIYYSYPFIILAYLCLCSIKDNVEDFDIEWFYAIIKSFTNTKTLIYESIFHILIKQRKWWHMPNRVVHELFKICCQLFDSVNDLNWMNETPLHIALENDGNEEFICLLLKYGAVTDTKNNHGKSIREMAGNYGRQDLCIGASSLQIQINSQLEEDHHYEDGKKVPAILNFFMKFH